ncbi:MAG: BBP7 family outer membrane beta-barrel protein, partial [Sedimentisphaerales bacterium]|nr:BBP7 family outer membrane beta-barrel protein [Sedimentisphaerales bacterium]
MGRDSKTRIITLLITILCLVPCAPPAQSQTLTGYWDRGHWIGYMPPHLKREYDERAAQSRATSAKQETVSAGTGRAVPSAEQSRPNRETPQEAAVQACGVTRTSLEEVEAYDVPPDDFQSAGPGDWDASPPASCDEYGCCQAAWCRPRCFWARAEYLGWWKQGMRLPALVTTNPSTYPTLDDPSTTVLFGGDEVSTDARSGGRFTLGTWLDPCRMRGLDFTYLGLSDETTSYRASGNDYAILGRPFFDVEAAEAAAHLIEYSNPDYSGWLNVTAETRFQGTELMYRRAAKRSPCSQVDYLVGWRWLQLKDNLLISESVVQPGTETIDLYDRFNT